MLVFLLCVGSGGGGGENWKKKTIILKFQAFNAAKQVIHLKSASSRCNINVEKVELAFSINSCILILIAK